ncbi:hypothetical protein [Niveispirillum sp. BGYR6]|uniref:hypothetical protein n=1 Tax=Niveispirillum sp. BGYR6 TaxID=2971249 RepID=UPI0022B9896E|nr:hypothetical protein [Niveispirillum sp. BGYR6]MDG5495433.1 hypothetical protein [Niveispirillum sp. BGYR6]
MIIDMRTRLPQGHLANNLANINFHAEQLRRSSNEFSNLVQQLQALDFNGLLRAFEAAR